MSQEQRSVCTMCGQPTSEPSHELCDKCFKDTLVSHSDPPPRWIPWSHKPLCVACGKLITWRFYLCGECEDKYGNSQSDPRRLAIKPTWYIADDEEPTEDTIQNLVRREARYRWYLSQMFKPGKEQVAPERSETMMGTAAWIDAGQKGPQIKDRHADIKELLTAFESLSEDQIIAMIMAIEGSEPFGEFKQEQIAAFLGSTQSSISRMLMKARQGEVYSLRGQKASIGSEDPHTQFLCLVGQRFKRDEILALALGGFLGWTPDVISALVPWSEETTEAITQWAIRKWEDWMEIYVAWLRLRGEI